MNKIYIIISELSDTFREMCYGITKDKEAIDDAVQELMIYYLQMNPETLKSIYEKDGKKGLIRYGAVVLKRALTSPRSPFYYKYKKYYTHIDSFYKSTVTDRMRDKYKSIYNIPEPIEVNYTLERLEKIDQCLENLYWYDSKVFQLYYYEGNTLDSLAKKTGISRNSLFTTIDKVREYIKEEVDD